MSIRDAAPKQLESLIAGAGNLGNMASHEQQRRLLSGDATWAGLQRAVTELEKVAPKDNDVVIQLRDLLVHTVRFIEPHTFLFRGIDQNGHVAAIVLHFTQVEVHVIYRPKESPNASRVITGFLPNAD